jgi:hypothetical protein
VTNPYAPPSSDPTDGREGRDRHDGVAPERERVPGGSGGAPGGPDAPPPAGPRPGAELPPERYGRPPSHGRPDPRPEDPAAYEALRRRLGLFLLLLVASLLVLSLPLPFQAASVVFSAWAVVVGARAVVAAWRGGIRRAAVPLAAGLVGIAMWMTLYAGLQLALWPVLQERQDCLREALTTSARGACEDAYQQGIEDRLTGLLQPRSTAD